MSIKELLTLLESLNDEQKSLAVLIEMEDDETRWRRNIEKVSVTLTTNGCVVFLCAEPSP